jgi:hypothetical protein
VVDNPNLEQQNAAAAALAPDFQAITSALTQATAAIGSSAAQLVVKGRDAAGGGGASCGHDCLLTKVQLLVWEIACTLKFVIVKLGLGKFCNNPFTIFCHFGFFFFDTLRVSVSWDVYKRETWLTVYVCDFLVACVLVYLQPLLFALVGLIKALDKVVAGLLIVVKSLLTFVLGTVAGAVLELLW